jgi:hypothetical protein
MGNVMDTKHNAAPVDSFTATANELRLTSGTARIALVSCHLKDAERDALQAFYHAVGAGDFERADEIGTVILEIQATAERLKGLAV